MYRIALNFEDGITQFIEAGEGESIADAAYRQAVNVPLDCANGVCGTCKARCQSGQYDPGGYSEDALTVAEAAEGYLLCCQARAESDMVVDIMATSQACKVRARGMVVDIADIEMLSPGRIRLSIAASAAELPMFLPGQYVNLSVINEPVGRSYSFASAPGSDVARFLIRNVPGGRMSSYLATGARKGDQLRLDGPFGSFYLRPPRRPLLLLAGGTGIAPILSMLEHLATERDCRQPVDLVYGARNEEDLVELERIEALKAAIPGFSYRTICSGHGNRHPLTGRVTDHLDASAVNGGDTDVYLCGPPDMVESARYHVIALGVPTERVYFEKFVPAAAA
ncbi:MAG: benzoate 1,2-dioxygenase electron transfer component BenC [Tardiphaga sp.]